VQTKDSGNELAGCQWQEKLGIRIGISVVVHQSTESTSPTHTHTRLWLNSRWFMRNLLDCSGWTGLSIDLLYQHSSFTFFIVLLHLFGLVSHNRVAWFFCLGLCEL